jgi:putative cell wall-binding protein
MRSSPLPLQSLLAAIVRMWTPRRLVIAVLAAALLVAGGVGSALPAQAVTTTASISGTVTPSSGASDPYVEVFKLGFGGTACYLQCAEVGYGDVDNETGAYTVTDLPAGQYVVEASDDSGSTIWSGGASSYATAQVITVASGQSVTGLDFTIAAGGSVSGTVTTSGVDLTQHAMWAGLFQKSGKIWHDVGTGSGNTYLTNAPTSYSIEGVSTGTYKVGFVDYATGDSAAATPAFLDNASNAVGASDVSVTAGQSVTGRNVTIKAATKSTVSNVSRISGSGRYETAVALAQAGYPSGAPVVFVATGTNYPDALAAGPAATKLGGPLLLTDPNALPSVVASEITSLHPSKVYVVGGTSAVSAGVLSSIQTAAASATVTRIAGTDRFDTSRKVNQIAFGGTTVPGAYVATGTNYPDALAAASAAGAQDLPVILVNGSASSIDQPTSSLVSSLGLSYVDIAGGPNAVSTGIENSLYTQLEAANPSSYFVVSRDYGADRFSTATEIARNAFVTDDTAYIATGLQFPDALAGSALAGATGHPLFTVPGSCVPAATVGEIERLGVTKLVLIGGTSAVTQSVATLTTC